jgi:hypothetical protein
VADLPKFPTQGDKLLITLRQPVCVMLNSVLRTVPVFEGELVLTSEHFQQFKVMRLFARNLDADPRKPPSTLRYDTITMVTHLTVNTHNIAGVLAQEQLTRDHRTSTPPTHVIVLAQGQQKRLAGLKMAKQLLRLPECNDVPLLMRTLCQLAMLGHEAITVVCAGDLKYTIEAGTSADILRQTGRMVYLHAYELGDPGNSSLKGLARYLDTQIDRGLVSSHHNFQTLVLLGDVVYSWQCLRAIAHGTHWNHGFVGTSDLSASGGELWGVSWFPSAHPTMLSLLDRALANHPPFEEYQPGQLRRWLWAMNDLANPLGIAVDGQIIGQAANRDMRQGYRPTWFTAIDDYTRDIDLPEHVNMLPRLSAAAKADDEANGLHWNQGVDEW